MTFVVPYDGSELAEAALVRADEFGAVLDQRVVAVTVIPNGNKNYARDRGWIGDDESFDTSAVVSTLHEQVANLCPRVDFRHEVVDRYAPPGTIAKRIKDVAHEQDASIVFVGSDDAGSIVSRVSSVGTNVASNGYDVLIVRERTPAKIQKIDEKSPHRREKSDFYVPG